MTKMKKVNYGDKKLKDAARWVHLIWFCRERAGWMSKRAIMREWNALYPSAKVRSEEIREKGKNL